MVPLLSISLAVAGLVLSEPDVREALSSVFTNMGESDVDAISSEVSSSIERTSTIGSLGVFGAVSLLLTASLVFVALQDAFDTIWEIPVQRGTWSSLRRRLVAFAVVMLAGALLVASFAVISISNLIRNLLPGDDAVIGVVADTLGTATTWLLLAAVIVLLLHFLTAERLRWQVSMLGGLATALILSIGNRLFVEYIQRFGSSSLVGATGTILVGIVWLYAIAQVVLAGAELTRTLQRRLPDLLERPG